MKNNFIKRTISDTISGLSKGETLNYIFSPEDISSLDDTKHAVLMGVFMSEADFFSIAENIYKATRRLYLIAPTTVKPINLRKFLIKLCGESQVYACSDGFVGTTTNLKGFTMALTLPVWNEAETLRKVIESFLPVVDQIIIGVDEKTDDGSEKIADEYSDEVFKFRWEKSFSKARNACLERCTTDWIFMTEGHEHLEENSYGYLRTLANLPNFVSMIKVRRVLENGKHSEFPWLTRNRCGIHYINDSHNAVISNNPECNMAVSFKEVRTIHERSEEKDDARRTQRKYMNRTYFLKELAKNPADSRSLFYIANEYFDFKEHEKAVTYYKRYLNHSDWAEERYQAKIFCSRCLLYLGRKKEATEMLMSCFSEPVARNEHMIILADIFVEERPDLSVYYLRMGASIEEPSSPMWIDPGHYREVPLQKLCIIYGKLGRLEDALACAEIVKEKFPETSGTDDIIENLKENLKDECKNWQHGRSSYNLIEC